jgi:hypothetical protein
VQYDIAFTNLYAEGMSSGQVIVAWGERGRIAEAAIKPRLKLVLQRIAPWISTAEVDSLPAPVMMRVATSWEANLAISPNGGMFSVPAGTALLGSLVNAPLRSARDDLKPRRTGHQP